MANTDRIAGKDLYVSFNGSDISADFTSVSVSDEDDQVDVTAGAETYHYFISLGRRTGTIDYEAFYNGGTAQTGFAALVPGTAGTMIIGPRGTASTMPKWTWSRVLVQNRNTDHPFDDAVKVTCSFQTSSLLSATNW